MAEEVGLQDDCALLIAHLYTENGAFAEDRHGDNGCSIGILQWNLCVHEKMSVKRWTEKNPEWKDWRFQVRFYLQKMAERKTKYKNIYVAIESWNFGGRPWYLKKVKSNLEFAKTLLQ